MTAFQRAPRPEATKQEASPELFNQNISTLLRAVENDRTINKHANVYEYNALYKEKGIDLEEWYRSHKVTAGQEAIKDNFIHNKKHGFAAELAESLPLFANSQGRLGDYFKVNVTKTAKPDDQGNSFIDLVIEVENTWLTTEESPKSLQDVPAKMTFLIDVTTAVDSEALDKKMYSLRNILLYGEKANVKCYQDGKGGLGIERPKIVVAKQSDYVEKVGANLGDCITQLASDKFSINKPDKFNEQYRKYFLDLMNSIGENATENARYIKGLEAGHPKRESLMREYEKINAFVEAYKKTPTTRKHNA